jgi:phage replication O-like protein O
MISGKDVQIDEGEYTRIHNAILETLFTARLSPLEFRIVLFVLRKTYGFHKKIDAISMTQFEECGGSRPATVSAVNNLIRLQVLTREKYRNSFRYGFNKYFEQWLPEVFETRRPHQIKNINSENGKANGTSKPNGTGKPDGTNIGKPDGTENGKADGTHKRNKEIKKDIPEQKIMFGELAKVCGVDMRLKAGQIGKTVKSLLSAGYTVDDITNFSEWWKVNDWRGKRGELPTMPQVVDNIYKSKNGNGHTMSRGMEELLERAGDQSYIETAERI